MTIAEVCLAIGAGRYKSSDKINHAVGVVLLKKDGEEVNEGDAWIEIRHDKLLEERIITKVKEALIVKR
ncbi:hypothetical protein Anas_11258 [Armadillidium nasatum]|uniref:Pyrimidine nucleoside phosphorylase C-terminal domain-containing protein n=1 Tax=Armadillidium nasatum TaxID=96803 RepID=A0A5N5STR1_9CRUS|nr:hypothetical protein Anas_11258 [Armadillidium nasatum]